MDIDPREETNPPLQSSPDSDPGPAPQECHTTRTEDVGPLHARFYRPFLLLVFIAAVLLFGALLWPFRHAVFLAAILALLLNPLRQRLAALMRGSRFLTAALLTIATLLFILMPAALLTTVLANEAGAVIEAGVVWFQKGGVASLADWITSMNLPDWLRDIVDKTLADPQKIRDGLAATATQAGKGLLAAGRGVAGQTANLLFQVLMLLLFLFYFLAERDRVVAGLRRLSPLRPHQEQELAGRLKTVMQSILAGGLAAGLTQGVATAVGLWIVGVDPLFWGMVAVAASLVPFVGLALIHVPIVVFLLAGGATGKALFLLAWWLLVVSTVDNIVRPFFISGGARLPTLMIFVSIVGGVLLFGPLGLIYGPISMSLCLVVFQLFIEAQSTEKHP